MTSAGTLRRKARWIVSIAPAVDRADVDPDENDALNETDLGMPEDHDAPSEAEFGSAETETRLHYYVLVLFFRSSLRICAADIIEVNFLQNKQ